MACKVRYDVVPKDKDAHNSSASKKSKIPDTTNSIAITVNSVKANELSSHCHPLRIRLLRLKLLILMLLIVQHRTGVYY